MKHPAARWSFLAASLLSAGFAMSCGTVGGGGGGSFFPPHPPPVSTLTITPQWPQPLPTAVLGQPYSTQLQATGGTPPYTWSTQLLGIPGMTLAPDGTLSGTPGEQATFIPNITVTDTNGATATASVELIVIAPLSFNTAAALTDQNVALRVYTYIAASGGVQPYTFSLAPGSSMPDGLAFTSQNGIGLIQGTPTKPGSYSFTVQVTDSFSPPFKISQTFTLNITNNLVLPQYTLPDAVQNIPYTEYIKPAGGTPPYQFVLGQNSSIPSGLLLDTATGKVSGTPTAVTVPFYGALFVMITDSSSPPATINPYVNITVQPPLSIQTGNLPDSARGLNYQSSIYIVGGREPYTVQLASGTLPDGVTISPSPYATSFDVSGVPTKDGLFQFTAKVSDSYETPNTATQGFQIRISDQMVLSGPTEAQILYNQSYSTTFPVTGGFPPYTWKMDPVAPGFTFDPSTGALSGTPNGASYTISNVNVHDSSTPPLMANYLGFSLTVYGKLNVLTSALPAIGNGSTTWLGLASAGGALPYQWSMSSGSLPPGMIFSTTGGNGTISGSPTQVGSYTFTVAISDGNTGNLHQTASRQLVLTVKDRGQMTRNDTVAQATPVSNIALLASISPYSDPSSTGPDVDVYSATAAPGSIVQVYASPNNNFLQPPETNSLQPVIEIVDANGVRYLTCAWGGASPGAVYNLPCVDNLPGTSNIQGAYYGFQIPGTGTAPITFYMRVSDARGDARPDFIYTFSVYGVN